MKAKQLQVDHWINTNRTFQFDVMDDRIKIIHAFQMLCPGCVYVGIPQTIKLWEKYQDEEVQIVGLHSVFENHHAMTDDALRVFVDEWRLPFPVGVDTRGKDEWMPKTMKDYRLQGTPSLIVIDHCGDIQLNHFGHMDQQKLEVFIEDLIKKKHMT
ncbi:MAG: TlpA family protein disulfide reductase [Pseudobacteriovorax sp.]|nr:TlpA family protein disulfide reductase [Pseudobacteriovorax sp.]